MSSRNRKKYVQQDLTDDEDSDIDNFTDDSRSRMKRHEPQIKHRRNTETLDLDHRDNEVIGRIQKMKEKSKHIRERRSGSLTNWPTTKTRESRSMTPSDEELKNVSSKFRKSSLTSLATQNQKMLSDSASEKEEDMPAKQKADKSSSKSIKQVKSNSPSENETAKEKPLKVSDSMRTKKKLETQAEDDQKPLPVPVRVKPESETRPLKILYEVNNVSKPSNEPLTTKEEKKNGQVDRRNIIEDLKDLKSDDILASTVKIGKIETKKVPITEKSIQEAQSITEDWECQHCTFVNEASSSVCTICCKTRVDLLQLLPTTEDDIDINEINDSILQNENDAKQKGKVRKISFLPGTKAH